MFDTIVVMIESATSIIWRVDVNALDLANELLFQRLESQQVVPEDQSVVEPVILRHTMLRVIRLLRIFHQNPWLQLRPVSLTDPDELESLFIRHDG
jgi:hypothetical protein